MRNRQRKEPGHQLILKQGAVSATVQTYTMFFSDIREVLAHMQKCMKQDAKVSGIM